MESVGKRNKKKVNVDFVQDEVSLIWNQKEKKQLLEALNLYGSNDLESISKKIPTKKTVQISSYIKNLERKADCFFMENDNSELLLRKLQDMYKTKDIIHKNFLAISLPILFIIMFEDFPSPSECDIDFREAYEYLFCSLVGLQPKNISKQTIDFVSNTLDEMKSKILEQSIELMDHVSKGLSEKDLESFFNSKFYNPLNFPEVQLEVIP